MCAPTQRKSSGEVRGEIAWGPDSTVMRDNVSILDSGMFLCISVNKVTRTYFVWRHAWNVRADTAQKLGGSKRGNAWGPVHHRCTARLRISYSLALTFIRYVQREYFIHSSKSNFASCFYYYASHDATVFVKIGLYVHTYVHYSVSVCYFYHFNHSNKFHTVYTTLLLFS